MLNITLEEVSDKKKGPLKRDQKRSLKRYLLEKVQQWINSLLEAERDEFLGRDRQQRLDENRDNYRNGYRPRKLAGVVRLGACVFVVDSEERQQYERARREQARERLREQLERLQQRVERGP